MFIYSFGQDVAITVSGECGKIKGRAEFIYSPNQYLLIYKTADGRAEERWVDETELSAVKPQEEINKTEKNNQSPAGGIKGEEKIICTCALDTCANHSNLYFFQQLEESFGNKSPLQPHVIMVHHE
ncbi:hypothetical protein REA38_11600 [Serratia sp. MF2]|uniref:hypothetical protein n=1 Tax=Serratia sp. MF1(2023) TaxID=3059171 RepID=UPI0027F1BBBC|nr:hypothetical protein [Serratia sp. MF1(2023)]MDQ7104194.1 hypothetical protein [Serratia sp. MF1(2023)]